MPAHTATPVTTVAEFPGQSDRRHGSRTPALFSLLYSGMDTGQMLIGDGVVTNLITGRDRHLRESIGHTRHGNGPLCRPSWSGRAVVHCPEPGLMVAGRRFGVELGTLKLEEKNHLRFFLWDRVTPSDRDGGI